MTRNFRTTWARREHNTRGATNLKANAATWCPLEMLLGQTDSHQEGFFNGFERAYGRAGFILAAPGAAAAQTRIKRIRSDHLMNEGLTYSDPRTTFSGPRATFSGPRAPFNDPRTTFSGQRATCNDPHMIHIYNVYNYIYIYIIT